MRILISGATGLIGTALSASLRSDGHTVSRLVRPGGSQSAGDVPWDPATGQLQAAAIEGVDAVVNLSGASVGEGRWTEARKKILRSSRLDATRTLVGGFAKLAQPPRAFLSASATGYYGNRGDEILTEESGPGNDFLSRPAMEGERLTAPGAKYCAPLLPSIARDVPPAPGGWISDRHRDYGSSALPCGSLVQ